VAALRSDRDVIPKRDVLAADIDPSEYDDWQRDLFAESQQLAAAAAAQVNGISATVTGRGAAVLGTVDASPAAETLEAGDTIVAVTGNPVQLASDVHDMVSAHPAGTFFVLTVERDGRTRQEPITSVDLPEVSGGVGLGVLAHTRDLQVELPFDIAFRPRPDVGGPSAGLVYALALADMLDATDDARGRTVAATGTISPEGHVGEVGAVAEKAATARDADADLFIVPDAERADADHSALAVIGVTTLAQAVEALQAS
jgi:PDZ domain-containing protein